MELSVPMLVVVYATTMAFVLWRFGEDNRDE